jgi:transcriptional regulator with XRE-family HTH domain
MARDFRRDLEERIKNPDFAVAFGASQAKSQAALALAKARRNAVMSQQVLAERSGHSQPYIAKLEGGEANPTLETIGSMIAIMGQRVIMDVGPLGFVSNTAVRPTVGLRINYDFVQDNAIQRQPTESSTYHEVGVKGEVRVGAA